MDPCQVKHKLMHLGLMDLNLKVSGIKLQAKAKFDLFKAFPMMVFYCEGNKTMLTPKLLYFSYWTLTITNSGKSINFQIC